MERLNNWIKISEMWYFLGLFHACHSSYSYCFVVELILFTLTLKPVCWECGVEGMRYIQERWAAYYYWPPCHVHINNILSKLEGLVSNKSDERQRQIFEYSLRRPRPKRVYLTLRYTDFSYYWIHFNPLHIHLFCDDRLALITSFSDVQTNRWLVIVLIIIIFGIDRYISPVPEKWSRSQTGYFI